MYGNFGHSYTKNTTVLVLFLHENSDSNTIRLLLHVFPLLCGVDVSYETPSSRPVQLYEHYSTVLFYIRKHLLLNNTICKNTYYYRTLLL